MKSQVKVTPASGAIRMKISALHGRIDNANVENIDIGGVFMAERPQSSMMVTNVEVASL